MKLRDYALEQLALMVIGDNKCFSYRSSYYITQFFKRCDMPFEHDGSTRWKWAKNRLIELNSGPSASLDLPSTELLRVLDELFNPDEFHREKLSFDSAIGELNEILKLQSLIATITDEGKLHVRNTGTGTISQTLAQTSRPLNQDELAQRELVAQYLDLASEDEFTSNVLVPLFQRLSFQRVKAPGHHEKILEYGKDIWMKYQLPTGHWLYFAVQVKRGKLDSRGGSGNKNVATVLDQIRMAIDHPILDPDTNRKVLIDHVFVLSAGEITRAARNWLGEQLDTSKRRQVIFMDRDELLDHAARISIDLKRIDGIGQPSATDELPF